MVVPTFSRQNFEIINFAGLHHGQHTTIAGIFVTSKETVSTDGACLVKISTIKTDILHNDRRMPLKTFKPFVLPKTSVEKLLKVFPRRHREFDVLCLYSVKDGLADFGAPSFELLDSIKVPIIQIQTKGEYPLYQDINIFAKKSNGRMKKEVEFNIRYPQKIFFQFEKLLSTTSRPFVKMLIPKYVGTPFVIKAKNDRQEAVALLMPLEQEESTTQN